MHKIIIDIWLLLYAMVQNITGKMSRIALNLIYDWLDKKKDALMENWERIE